METSNLNSCPLISALELIELIPQDNVKIFDIRGTWKTPARALPNEYSKGHIPGAVFLDWTQEFIQQGTLLNLASVASEQEAQESFKRLGIHPKDHVVIYDDYHHMFAGRIWWAMRYWGFDHVSVLNGGWHNWVNQKLPVSTDIQQAGIGSFKPKKYSFLNTSLDNFLEKKEQAYVIDARSEENYKGKPDDPRTGHIPGVINLPFRQCFDKDTGLFLSSTKLQRVFDSVIPEWRSKPVISSCGSGYAGTVPLMALASLGIEASLFDGSFAVWKQDPQRMIEQSFIES